MVIIQGPYWIGRSTLLLLPRRLHRLGGCEEKGGEKGNYQSNRKFPFLYPLPSSPNVGKEFTRKYRWKEEDGEALSSKEVGGRVAARIEEGDLFSGRVGPTLAMKICGMGEKHV